MQKSAGLIGSHGLRALSLTAIGLVATLACSAGEKGAGSGRAGVEAEPGSMPDLVDDGAPGAGDPGLGGFGEVGGPGNGTPGSGCATTVSGVTRDPAGRLPLYNVVAYVPSEALSAISSGASCETCSGDFSGRPIAATVSDATGKFTLDITNVPSRTDIPLVIQAGKWRRQVTIPAASDCADTPLETELTRLPRNRSEGNLPHVAVMRGGSDAIECIFTKIGVDLTEFSPGGGGGAVELYYSTYGENDTAATGQMTGAGGPIALPLADTLFDSYETMRSFDMLMLSCEGGDERYEGTNFTHRENWHRYANEGGRIFGGHYHNKIISNAELEEEDPTHFPPVVNFIGSGDITPKTFTANVNTSFEKGNALADWLVEVGASTTRGQLQVTDSEHTVFGMIDPNAVSWISTTAGSAPSDLYYGFPTPVEGPACGRMVFTDVHLASGSGDSAKTIFPSCSDELTPQQLALAFLIFDLANCVQTTDTEPPPVPMIY